MIIRWGTAPFKPICLNLHHFSFRTNLDVLKISQSSNAEVWDVLERGSWDLSVAPAHRAALLSAFGAAQRRRAVQVPRVRRRAKLWGWTEKTGERRRRGKIKRKEQSQEISG